MAMRSKDLKRRLDQCWTTQEVLRQAGVTAMTIRLWRVRARDPLPAIEVSGGSRPAIRFVPAEVKAWAKRNDVVLKP